MKEKIFKSISREEEAVKGGWEEGGEDRGVFENTYNTFRID